MTQILKTPQDFAAEMLAALPRGRIWPRDLSGLWGRLLLGSADEMARVRQSTARLLDELDPRTTTDMLDDWEHAYGLPDPCVAPPTTTDERRRRLVQLVAMKGSTRKRFLTGLAYSLGYDVLLEEFAPATMGLSRCGERMDGLAWRWAIFCHAATVAVTRSYMGTSYCGERLTDFGNASLECILHRHVPATAQTALIFGYEEPQDTFGAAVLWQQPGPASGAETALPARTAGATYFIVGELAAENYEGFLSLDFLSPAFGVGAAATLSLDFVAGTHDVADGPAGYGLIVSAARVVVGENGGDGPRVVVPLAGLPAGRLLMTVVHDDSDGRRMVTVRVNGAELARAEADGAGTVNGSAVVFGAGGLAHFGVKLGALGVDEIDWLERVVARQFAVPLAEWPANLAEGA